MKKILFTLSFCTLLTFQMTSKANELALPTDAFGSLPDVSHVLLSPNGDKIVSRILINTPEIKGTAYQVTNLDSKESKMVLFTDNIKFDLNWVRWKTNDILLAGIIYPDSRSTYGPANETRETDLIVVNTKTDQTHNLFKLGFFSRFKEKPAGRDRIVDILPNDPDHILVQITGRLSDMEFWSPRVYKLNLHTQQAELAQKKKNEVIGWKTDQQNRVRLATKFSNNDLIISVRDIEKDKWRDLWRYRNYTNENITPLGFDKDPNKLYVRAYKNDHAGIFSVDLQDPELNLNPLLTVDNYDVDGSLIYSNATQEVIGISSSYGNDAIYFDESYIELQRIVNKALPSTSNSIYSFSKDETKYLVYADSDIESGTYLFGDREKGSLNVIAYRYQNLPPTHMSPKKKWNYSARDGETIEGFLTIPKGSEAKMLPTIIFPHGGPISYDSSGFDFWVQFYANRGYAVLQPNFRGSSGQGYQFRNAGIKDHSIAMEDIEDGARALIKAGITDPRRLCIAGASFGGYAALYGVTKTPDLYACAISFAGLSDVSDRLVLNDENRLIRGGPNTKKLSPVNFAKNAKSPVLLIHGDNDRQVDVSHSEKMYSALKRAKKDVKYIELKNEDHFLTNNNNRKLLFQEMDKFLKEHLPTN
jgi:dipeptidyl aminopeptidase/acylaminoacyl peptidase